jgi:gluconokinase
MSAGLPLNDDDRAPWLAAIRAHIDDCLARSVGSVVTCSALKERYRAVLIADSAHVKLVHLTGEPALLAARIGARQGHFMKPEMLQSQLATLEPPHDALNIDIAPVPDVIVAHIRRELSL